MSSKYLSVPTSQRPSTERYDHPFRVGPRGKVITAAFPRCTWCTWVYAPSMGGKPFVLKFPHRACEHYGMINRG